VTGIAGKVALVTGAARRRGIGRATALRLAAEGADVACLDIARPYADFPGYGVAAADELDEVVHEIEARGRRALALLNKDGQFELMIGAIEGSLERWIGREIPIGRLQTADDVAAAIVFLCSDDAGYITGEALNVSGGQTMV
jgi:NAD(P)-dependent dehydrogenase (short-subunit alcohol dehydrogenase family)